MVTVDVPHVFRTFGGPRGLLRVLTKHEPDHGLTYNQVQMWLQRAQIPSRWVGLVFYVGKLEGRKLNEFLTDPQELVQDKSRQNSTKTDKAQKRARP